MKNTSISKILLAATAVMFLFSACQKDTVTLKARFEQFNNGSKLHLSNRTSSWDEGDQIYIDGYWYEINGDGYISEVRASNRYVAYFVTPNTVTISDDAPAQFSIPAVQQYTVDGDVQKVFTPMYANSTSTTLSFKNMGAVLAIQLSNTSNFSNLTIDKIEITATNLLLWGDAVIDDTDPDAPTFSCIEGNDVEAQRTLTLKFDNNPLTVSTSQTQTPTVYVSVPAVLGNNIDNRFTIKIYTHQGGTRVEYTRSQSVAYSGSIYRNQWANVPFAFVSDNNIEHISHQGNLPDGILNYNYVFSVNATQKVYFSQGNLQYDIDNDRWQFAATQQEIIGSNNIYNITNNTGVIDLFGYGTSGLGDNPDPTETSTTGSDYASANLTVSSTGSDWGSNVIYNGALPENPTATWRTLKKAELNYMLGTGGMSKRNVDGQPDHSGRNYAFDVVNLNGTIGVLIYPDASSDVTQPGSPQYSVHSTFGGDNATKTFDISNIGLQNLPGCVFLPASLQRFGTVYNDHTGILSYWTASYNSPGADSFTIRAIPGVGTTTYETQVGSTDRRYGLSVRLVYNAN